ncbi:aminopeptidase P N-terminal domain-containing protein [Spirosoma sp. KUDC1026]|uniref:aminopeptidase P N-terminal domain-containing protein n=1 Tax=Spirosoma sp. KUDC1026 TaxID=2745947 RepID=UPI00159BB466|nr:aminopeptidase P N-terminal domain-containing protein [Spirosoma sp. KUDC1026]QKZ15307.1 aminopeptidase P N-terminal domain-containing protein [Spirosoma sp. KUDC1026]
MRYLPIDNQLFVQNRQRLTALLKPKSLVVVNANDIMPTNADGTMVFRQNNDLFYLTGVDQEETRLVLFPDHPDPKFREVLFLRETSELIEIWEGHKLTKAEAEQTTGISQKQVYWTHQFEQIFGQMIFEAENVYLNTNEHTRASIVVQTQDARYIDEFRHKYPLHHLQRLAPLMHQLRAIKAPQEIALLQTAIDITDKMFRRLLTFIKPGVWEYEIEAEMMHEYLMNRSRGAAYTPIIASGANACVLHYIDNSAQCQDGDVILLDIGAEYANYNADMTRSVPVNGRFTQRQRAVYDAVLRVLNESKQMLRPGNLWDEYHREVGKIMESELIGLGLLDAHDVAKQDPDAPLYKKYFMHGTSHFLGLDVHDVGNKYRRMEPGMVFTVEPGIYIPAEKLGIRLENNVVITEAGCDDLMANIPLEADHIEDLMNT